MAGGVSRTVKRSKVVMFAPAGLLAVAVAAGDGWLRTWDGPASRSDRAGAVSLASDGTLIVAASSSLPPATGVVMSWMPAGDVSWTATDPSVGDFTDVVVTSDGVVVTASPAPGGDTVVVGRSLASGAELWRHGVPLPDLQVRPTRLSVDSWRNRVLTVVPDGGNLHILSWSSAGVPAPTVTVPAVDRALGPGLVVPLEDGGMVVTAESPLPATGGGWVTVRLDGAGAELWRDHEPGAIGSTFSPAWAFAAPDGGVVVAASAETTCGVGDLRVWRIGPDGNRHWRHVWPPDPCAAIDDPSAAVAPDGSVVVAATLVGGDLRIAALTVAPDGGRRWLREWQPGGRAIATGGVAVGPWGSSFVGGATGPWSAGDAGLLGIDRAGRVCLERFDDVTAGAEDRWTWFEVDPADGAVWAVGETFDPVTSGDVVVARLSRGSCDRPLFADGFESGDDSAWAADERSHPRRPAPSPTPGQTGSAQPVFPGSSPARAR